MKRVRVRQQSMTHPRFFYAKRTPKKAKNSKIEHLV